MKAPLLTFALLLAACDSPSNTADRSNAHQQAKAGQPASKAFKLEEKTDLAEFDYGWSSEAAAVPELVERFRADLVNEKADLIANAQEEKAYRDKEAIDFHPHSSSTAYETAGQAARLLSLREDSWEYTGGAHGNGGTAELLWDRAAKAEIQFADLFTEAANMGRMLTQRWCDALNRAREEKRGEPVGGGGMFDDCPPLNDIAIIPADKDGNGRFERLLLVASPYVAGPYAEGSYEIELGVTPDLVAVMKSEFRPSFEAQGRQ